MAICPEEEKLVQQLKDICYPNGREKNPPESVDIFHALGKFYRKKSPDKVALIQSATLFNAALVRNPNSLDVKNSLTELCSHILALVEAQKKNESLLDLATHFKNKMILLRQKVARYINGLESMPDSLKPNERLDFEKRRIKEIQYIQQEISAKYSDIMKEIAESCADLLGKPPCRYALVGMGSLAKREITPYSDFECMIVLEDTDEAEPKVEYFRWFSVVFQVILINFGETLVPCVAIPSLNDSYSSDSAVKQKYNWFYDSVTPSGISFDGMVPYACKAPLGRQQTTELKEFQTELIRPVSEMLQYLGEDEDLKNGYHLADMLTKTCLVQGDSVVYDQFYNGVNKKLQSSEPDEGKINDSKVKIALEFFEDYKKLNLTFNTLQLELKAQIDIKKLVYRGPTLTICTLARYHGIRAVSCYDMVDALVKKQILQTSDAHEVKYAVAVSCQLRLKVYSDRGAQNDHWAFDGRSLLNEFKGKTKELQDMLGHLNLLKCLETGKILQESVNDYFLSKPSTTGLPPIRLKYKFFNQMSFQNLLGFSEAERLSLSRSFLDQVEKSPNFDDWESVSETMSCLGNISQLLPYETLPIIKRWFTSYKSSVGLGKFRYRDVEMYSPLSTNLIKLDRLDEALQYLDGTLNSLKMYKFENPTLVTRVAVTTLSTLYCKIFCLKMLGRTWKALEVSYTMMYLYEAVFLKEVDVPGEMFYPVHIAVAECLMKLNLYDDAIASLEKCVKKHERAESNLGEDKHWCSLQVALWQCYLEKQLPEKYNELAVRLHTGNYSEKLETGDMLACVCATVFSLCWTKKFRKALQICRTYITELKESFGLGQAPVFGPRIHDSRYDIISDPGLTFGGYTFGSFLSLFGSCLLSLQEYNEALVLFLDAEKHFRIETIASPAHVTQNRKWLSTCNGERKLAAIKAWYLIAENQRKDCTECATMLEDPKKVEKHANYIYITNNSETLNAVSDLIMEKSYNQAYKKIMTARDHSLTRFDDIDSKMLHHLAQCYREFGRFHDAIAVCQTAIRIRQEVTENAGQDGTLLDLFDLLNESYRQLGCSPVKNRFFMPLVSVHARVVKIKATIREVFLKQTEALVDTMRQTNRHLISSKPFCFESIFDAEIRTQHYAILRCVEDSFKLRDYNTAWTKLATLAQLLKEAKDNGLDDAGVLYEDVKSDEQMYASIIESKVTNLTFNATDNCEKIVNAIIAEYWKE